MVFLPSILASYTIRIQIIIYTVCCVIRNASLKGKPNLKSNITHLLNQTPPPELQGRRVIPKRPMHAFPSGISRQLPLLNAFDPPWSFPSLKTPSKRVNEKDANSDKIWPNRHSSNNKMYRKKRVYRKSRGRPRHPMQS
jgi:hypothetical protein